jgi:hypothetical protein
MHMKLKFKKRGDKGAVAAFLAITTTFVLLASGAIAVDLGNAWARKRDAQRQVDVAALAASHLLPVTSSADRTAIAQAVLDNMRLTDNGVSGQNLSPVTASNLLSSGMITFQYQAAKGGPFVSCPLGSVCTQMTVNSPDAKVDFGLAGVLGVDSVDVSKQAMVRVATELPPGQDVMPFWLPNGCVYGPAEPDTTQGNGNGGGGSGAEGLSGGSGGGAAALMASPTPTGPQTISGPSPTITQTTTPTTQLQYVISDMAVKNTAGVVRFVSSDGLTNVDAAVSDTDGNQNDYKLTTQTFVVPAQVASTPGVWSVYGFVQEQNGANKPLTYSKNALTLTVVGNGSSSSASSAPTSPSTGSSSPSSGSTSSSATPSASPTGIPVGCTGQDRGNFGQLASPRIGYNLQNAFPVNIALGLDHQLVPYQFNVGSPIVTSCSAIPPTQPPHYNDDVSRTTAPFNNCIKGDTGNDPKMLDGFVTGTNGYPGRLDAQNGHTTCPSRSDMTFKGVTINNDVLSCFLQNGATLADLASDHADNTMLNGEVTKSPRFVWLPVVYASDRTVKDFQPLKMFVPGFITDETTTTPASSTNGLTLNGNGNALSKFTVFTFNPKALPANEQSPIVDYDPTLGNPVYFLVG